MAYTTHKPYQGYLGDKPDNPTYETMVIDNIAHKIHKVVVHTFTVGDVEDPGIYAAEPLYRWEKSEIGQWVMKHAVETPMWHQQQDYMTWGYKYAITAKLKEQDYLIWALKK